MKCYWQCFCLLLQVTFFIANCLEEDLILNINFKKPIAVTDHAFLSFTLDPTILHNNAFIENIEKSTNMAQGLAPAYVRFGGAQSNSYNFEQTYSHEIDTNTNDVHFGTQWTFMYQWAKKAGLEVITCITPQYIDNKSKTHSTDSKNIVELLSFSDRMGYNISWQLGYECQKRCDLSGGELGQYVANLREMLKTFPRYSNSLLTGPDIVAYKTEQQQRYLQDYLHSANAALSAITWHPDLASVSLNNDSVSIQCDNMIAEKNEIDKIINRTVGKKPLWIAESKPEECKYQYLGALIWTRRLGNAAKLGIQVVMRQLLDFSKATPDYWVSLLYKTLVDREVLDTRFNNKNVHFYSQCTKPSALYSKGAITIYGINLSPKRVTASLKDSKIKILHKYILSPSSETGNKMFSEEVLLNGKPLNLINNEKLPDINPEIIINPDGLELELPSGGIGFWVIPNAKVKACTYFEEEIIGNTIVKNLSKRHKNDIQEDNQKVKEDISQTNLKIQKFNVKQDRRKQKNIGNANMENQQKIWNSKLFERIKKILDKRLQKKENNESILQKSLTIVWEKEQGSSSEEMEKQQSLNNIDLKQEKVDNKLEGVRETLKKYKLVLLQKKTQIDANDIQDLKLEIQNIDNLVALISNIDATLFHEIISNKSTVNGIKNKIQNREIFKLNTKLKEYLIELENSAITNTNIMKKIEKYFNMLYNLLEDNNPIQNNNSSKNKNLIEKRRFKRHLSRKSGNLKKIRILRKRSQIDDLKNYILQQKIKRKNNDRKKLILSNYINNLIKNVNNKNKCNNQRDSIKRFIKRDTFKNAACHTDYQHLVQKRTKKDNIYKMCSKTDNILKNYQSLRQEPKRRKRDINKRLVEIGLRKDSVFRKHSKTDDLKNYVNDRKTKQKDDTKREGLLIPFNPKIADSSENNFYGFFRRNPVKGFPETDIFVTTGDSKEKNGKDYDYVEDADNDNDSSDKRNTHNQKSMIDHTEDNIWIEEGEDNHRNYLPNEFFENIKLSNTKIQASSKDYDDLWEAEFLPENQKYNNNKSIITDVEKQPSNEEKNKYAKEKNTQKIDNYYNPKEQEYSWDKRYKTPGPDIGYSSTSFDQFPKTSIYSNYQASNIDYDNYHDKDKLREEQDISMSLVNTDDINTKLTQYSRPSAVCAEYSTHDNIFHTKRTKRSNWEKLGKIFAEEMIKEDEGNARDCHCRIIRASSSPKKPYFYRTKRNNPEDTTQFIDVSPEIKSKNTNIAQSEKNVQNSMTKEEFEKIIAGEILPSTNVTEFDGEENSTTTEAVITDSSTLDNELSSTTQIIDIISTAEIDNTSRQCHNTMKSTTMKSSTDSISQLSRNNDNTAEYITKETFFRTQSSNIQSEDKTTTNDPTKINSKISSENKDSWKEPIVSTINISTQKTTCENIQDVTKEGEKANRSINSITTSQKNEERDDNNYKTELKSSNFIKEATKSITEEQVTTETILSKRAANVIDHSNESKEKTKLLQNVEDNQNSKSKVQTQLRKDINMKRLKAMQNLPRTSLEELNRYETYLTKRVEKIDRQKEKLYAKREKLFHQYQDELAKIVDERKRNLKRREIWEKFRENNDFRQLIDQSELIGLLINDNVSYENSDENRSYLLAKIKKMRNPEHNEYYQSLQNFKVDLDDEEAETSRSSERKYNLLYRYFPKVIERLDNQYVSEEISSSMDTYRDDKTSEEFEYENFTNLQSKNIENISDEENSSYNYSNDVSENIEDTKVELEKKDEQYKIKSDKTDKYLEVEKFNKEGIFLVLPWKNIKKRQKRQSEINNGIAQMKHEVIGQSQSNKLILTEDNLENKRSRRYYSNNNIHKEEENVVEKNDIKSKYLKSQTNKQNRNDLLEDFIKAHKKNNLYNNEVYFERNEEKYENIPLNNISKNEKKLLQEAIPKLQDATFDEKLQNHTKSIKEYVNNSEENFNNILTSDEDKYKTKSTANTIHTAIMNIKKFFSKIPHIFMQ
ncbi:hypothetical protein P5V15_005336 [Pogonomyrmex californicus]